MLHKSAHPITPYSYRLITSLLLALVFTHSAPLWAAPIVDVSRAENFPRPAELETDVQFWIRIYSKVTSSQGLIHDDAQLGVVYQQLDFEPGLSRKNRSKRIAHTIKSYQNALLNLAKGKRKNLNTEEQHAWSLWQHQANSRTFRKAAASLRFQLGQSNRFAAGIERSGTWLKDIRKTLRNHGVPEELAVLPHVESSYHPKAYSFIGAAGLWQFTRSTGKLYLLRMNSILDERLDPEKATVAAAKLLRDNYRSLGSWPLAITAYNHGTAGMHRAKRQHGGNDIVKVLRRYKYPRFGFSSRNFYVAFLAALDVTENSHLYFGDTQPKQPEAFDSVLIDDYIHANTLAGFLGVDTKVLANHNLALRSSVWQGQQYVPRGYVLKIPSKLLEQPAEQLVAKIPPQARFQLPVEEIKYKTLAGDNLSSVAQKFHIKLRDLISSNGISIRATLRIGQILKIPVRPAMSRSQSYLASSKNTQQSTLLDEISNANPVKKTAVQLAAKVQ